MGRTEHRAVIALALLVLAASGIAAVDDVGSVPETGIDGRPGTAADSRRLDTETTRTTGTSLDGAIPAIDATRDEGVLIPVTVARIPRDALLVDIEHVNHARGLQGSIRTASDLAHDRSGLSERRGYFVALDAPNRWRVVAGRSGGLMVYLSMIATDPDIALRRGTVATGAVLPDGTVGHVADVRAKVRAARDRGKETVLVPDGQSVAVDGIRVIEVSTVSEARKRGLRPHRSDERPASDLTQRGSSLDGAPSPTTIPSDPVPRPSRGSGRLRRDHFRNGCRWQGR